MWRDGEWQDFSWFQSSQLGKIMYPQFLACHELVVNKAQGARSPTSQYWGAVLGLMNTATLQHIGDAAWALRGMATQTFGPGACGLIRLPNELFECHTARRAEA